MLRIISAVVNGLVSGSRFTVEMRESAPGEERTTRGARYSRNLFIDVEAMTPELLAHVPTAETPEGETPAAAPTLALVIRGTDKTLVAKVETAPTGEVTGVTGSDSKAADPEDKKYHRPALYWSDETAKPRPFVVATGDDSDRDALDALRAEVLAFFHTAAPTETAPAGVDFLTRCETVSDETAAILPALIAIFGAFGPVGRVAGINDKPERAAAGTTGAGAKLSQAAQTLAASLAALESQRAAMGAAGAALDPIITDLRGQLAALQAAAPKPKAAAPQTPAETAPAAPQTPTAETPAPAQNSGRANAAALDAFLARNAAKSAAETADPRSEIDAIAGAIA